MKFKDIKVRQTVEGYCGTSEKVTGKVIEKLKTRVKIDFNGKIVTYDKGHVQFLTISKGRNRNVKI